MNKYDSIKGLTADFNSVEEKRGGGVTRLHTVDLGGREILGASFHL